MYTPQQQQHQKQQDYQQQNQHLLQHQKFSQQQCQQPSGAAAAPRPILDNPDPAVQATLYQVFIL